MFNSKFITKACAAALLLSSGFLHADSHADAMVLRSADTHSGDYPTVQAVEYMSELLQKWTAGQLSIDVYHSRQLGEEKDTIEQTRFGVIDMNRINMAPLNNLIPETAIPSLPYVFRSTEHMRSVADGPLGAEIMAAFEEHGMIGLAFYDSGARSFYNSVRPVTIPADLKGLKIRVQKSDLFMSMINALGANATPMPFGEVYSALQTGVIDGAENNWPSYESTKHFEVAKYYALDQHSMSPEVLVMSKKSWDKLSLEQQVLVKAAAQASVVKMRELWDARVNASRAIVEANGNEIVQVDKQAFIDAMGPVYDQFVTDDKLRDLLRRIQAAQ
jgi:tripartite ATP-independent transporter DctP family solute receptor